jgi:hypothetical protein
VLIKNISIQTISDPKTKSENDVKNPMFNQLSQKSNKMHNLSFVTTSKNHL